MSDNIHTKHKRPKTSSESSEDKCDKPPRKRAKLETKELKFGSLTLDPALKHVLPFLGIESRTASAHILTMYDLLKVVIKTCLLACRNSRAFIIS